METKVYVGATEDSKAIRTKVFIDEQGFTKEFDEHDLDAKTVVVYNGKEAIGTGRAFMVSENVCRIGRVAILKEYRGKGVGKLVVDKLLEIAKEYGADKVIISSQCSKVGFYEKCGFKVYGEKYFDEHVEHILMEKIL